MTKFEAIQNYTMGLRLAVQAREPSLDPQHSCQQTGVAIRAPLTQVMGTGGVRDLV